MLFLRRLETTTRGVDIFKIVDEFFTSPDVDLHWTDCVAVSTDGAPAKIGIHRGFVALVKRENPRIMSTHCMIHRQALVVNTLEPDLEQLMKDVTNIINLIKAQPLTTRLFRQLCEEANSEHSTLLLYYETRWLSRGNALERLWILKSEVKNLLTDKKHCLAIHFQDTKWLSLFAYLMDIFGHLNEINTNLQGPKHNTISIIQKMCAFKSKLELWRMRAVEGKIASFSRFAKYLADTELSFESLKDVVLQHLGKLNKRFEQYFPEDTVLKESVGWVINPFRCSLQNLTEKPHWLAEQLIELQADVTAQSEYETLDLETFWMSEPAKAQPLAREEAIKLLLPFATTYLCEAGFSALAVIKTESNVRCQLMPQFEEIINSNKCHMVRLVMIRIRVEIF